MTIFQERPAPSLRDLLPPLLPDEYEALKASIAERGYVGEPIIGDQDGGIVDGFHRQRACDELGIDCPREVRLCSTKAEKYELALRLNCRRRQLNRTQKRALIGVYLRCDPQIPDKHLADIIGASQNTVARVRENLVATFQIEKFDKLRGRDGKERPTKYTRIVANTAKELETALDAVKNLPPSCDGKIMDTSTAERRARRHARQQVWEGDVIVPSSSDAVRLHHCRFQDLEKVASIAPASVGAIITDIPYGEPFLPQVSELGEFAHRVLMVGGLLVTYSGQYFLDEVMRRLGEHLTWGWEKASIWDGDGTLVHPRQVMSLWKPILVWSKGPWQKRGLWPDVLKVNKKEKDWDDWQQPLEEAERLVRYFSQIGDLVADCCGGGFTTAIACRNLGRRFVGCDIDEQCVLKGQARLAELPPSTSASGPAASDQTGPECNDANGKDQS